MYHPEVLSLAKIESLSGSLLAQTALFAVLDRKRCASLALQALQRTHAKGDVIFTEENRAEGLVILGCGVLRLTRRTAHGGSMLLGEQIGPCGIVTTGLLDGESNGVTAAAGTPCTTYLLSRESFLSACRDNPELAIRLLAEIGPHLRRTSAFIDLISTTDMCQRVARVLLELMEEVDSPSFSLPCSHVELASRLGTVREVIYRKLKELESRGVLRIESKHIIVTDPQALFHEAGPFRNTTHVFELHATPPIPVYFVLAAKAVHRSISKTSLTDCRSCKLRSDL